MICIFRANNKFHSKALTVCNQYNLQITSIPGGQSMFDGYFTIDTTSLLVTGVYTSQSVTNLLAYLITTNPGQVYYASQSGGTVTYSSASDPSATIIFNNLFYPSASPSYFDFNGMVFINCPCIGIPSQPVYNLCYKNYQYVIDTISGAINDVPVAVTVTSTCTEAPTSAPTFEPTIEPTAGPTDNPTTEPTLEPTVPSTTEPTSEPTNAVASAPTAMPTPTPTSVPIATGSHTSSTSAQLSSGNLTALIILVILLPLICCIICLLYYRKYRALSRRFSRTHLDSIPPGGAAGAGVGTGAAGGAAASAGSPHRPVPAPPCPYSDSRGAVVAGGSTI